jgi:quercetin dioxygenase-like cupin family protein
MSHSTATVRRIIAQAVLTAGALVMAAGACLAQTAAPDFTASPDVYRVRAENDKFRVVEATWRPGQRDQFHSHPTKSTYWVTDCSARFHRPDGSTYNMTFSAGTSGIEPPVDSHSVENVGKSDCKAVMFELK